MRRHTGSQRKTHRLRIEPETKIRRGPRCTLDMPLQQEPACWRFVPHCFQDPEIGNRGALQDRRLGEAFPVLPLACGIPHNPAARTVFRAAGLAVHYHRADGHIESGTPVRQPITAHPGVDTTRRPLQFPDDLHGAHLRSPRDRGAGEKSPDGSGQVGTRARLHGGYHLVDGRIMLHLEQSADLDTAGFGNPSEIIADHIHDHHVFRPVLRRGPKFVRHPPVLIE